MDEVIYLTVKGAARIVDRDEEAVWRALCELERQGKVKLDGNCITTQLTDALSVELVALIDGYG